MQKWHCRHHARLVLTHVRYALTSCPLTQKYKTHTSFDRTARLNADKTISNKGNQVVGSILSLFKIKLKTEICCGTSPDWAVKVNQRWFKENVHYSKKNRTTIASLKLPWWHWELVEKIENLIIYLWYVVICVKNSRKLTNILKSLKASSKVCSAVWTPKMFMRKEEIGIKESKYKGRMKCAVNLVCLCRSQSPICETYHSCSECTNQFFCRIWPMRRIHLPWVRQMLQPWRACSLRL